MAFVIKDRVFEYTTTTGTGTLTLAGTKSGYQQFAVVGNGNTTYYTIVAANGDWESGIGTYTSSGTTLARTTVLASSNSNNLVNFAAGTKEVFSSLPASSYLDASGTLADNSDTKVPSQKAIKTYVDAQVEKTPFRNRLINGDFLIDVYNGGVETTINASGKFAVNRWRVGSSPTSKLKTHRIVSGAMPLNTRSYLRVKVATAVASPAAGEYFTIQQAIEGFHTYDFNFGTADASPVTLSFEVRCSVAGTYSVALRNGDTNKSYIATYTINSADTWEDKSITIPGETTGTWNMHAGIGCILSFCLGGGSTHTASSTDTWNSGNYLRASGSTQLISNLNATFDITNVQLEKGSVATSYEAVDMATQYTRCERYYQLCYANTRGYAPSSGGLIETPISFRTLMRAVPTTSLAAGNRVNVNSALIKTPTAFGARHEVVSVGAGDTYAIWETAIFDAEL